MRRLAAACLLVAGTAGAAPAADRELVDPDRPDISSSATIAPPGAVQLESGMFYAKTRTAGEPTEHRLSLEAVLRLGVIERLEVRLEMEPIVRFRGTEDLTDVGNFGLSAKWRFFDAPDGSAWPALALNPFVKLPTAPEPIDSGKTDFGLRLIASFQLPASFNLDANAGLAAIGQSLPDGYLPQAQVSASLSRQLVRNLGVFAEVVYGSRDERGGRDMVGVDGGVTWRILPSVALDAAVGTSLYGSLPDVFVRAGGSIRFGR